MPKPSPSTRTSNRRTRAIGSLRRQLTGRGLIRLLRATGVPMPMTARVYLLRGIGMSGEIDIDTDHPITISTKAYDRKDR